MMASLNTNPGSSTKAQRCMLHKIKRRHGWSDDQLHAAIGTGSTKDLSAKDASDHIERLSGVTLPNPPGRKPSVYPAKKVPGVARMITQDHVDQIVHLGMTHFASPEHFKQWLVKDFKLARADRLSVMIRQLATAQRAGQVIRVLKQMHARRARRPGSPA